LNLGVAFAEKGHHVLLIDLDPQGNLTMSQGLNPDEIERSMFDVLVHKVPIQDVIEEREVDIGVSSIDLAGAELALSSMIGRERALEKALAPIKDDYDFIMIDTPPSLGLLTINAFVAADSVIVPVQCEYLSLRGLVQLENTLAMVRENLNAKVGIEGILPTMYDQRLLHSKEAVDILVENFGDLVFKTRIRKTIRFAEAPVKGESVLKYDPNGEAAEMYRDLAKEVLGKSGKKARVNA
jgi:chromosome partitioning protein